MKIDIKNYYAWPITTRILLMGLICALVFYLAYRWDIASLKSDLMNEETKERDLKQQLELIVHKEKVVTHDVSPYALLEDLLIQWQKKLINYSDLPELLNNILKIGSTNQIYFSQFNPGEETKENIYLKLPLKIIAVGSYHHLAEFISQVANIPWIIVVSGFTISNENKTDMLGSKLAEEANAKNLLTIELTFDIYRLADKNAKLPAVTPPVPPQKKAGENKPGAEPNAPKPTPTPPSGPTTAPQPGKTP